MTMLVLLTTKNSEKETKNSKKHLISGDLMMAQVETRT